MNMALFKSSSSWIIEFPINLEAFPCSVPFLSEVGGRPVLLIVTPLWLSLLLTLLDKPAIIDY